MLYHMVNHGKEMTFLQMNIGMLKNSGFKNLKMEQRSIRIRIWKHVIVLVPIWNQLIPMHGEGIFHEVMT